MPHFAQGLPEVALLDDAISLGVVGRRHHDLLAVGHLEQLDRLRDPVQEPVPVRLDTVRHDAQRPPGVLAEKRLATNRGRHDARHHRQPDAVDLDRLRAPRDVLQGIGPKADLAEMDARPRLDPEPSLAKRVVVRQRVSDGVAHRIEQQQHAVGLVDLPAAPHDCQIARHPVVCRPQGRRGVFVEALGQSRALDDIGQ